MESATVTELKARLSRYLARVKAGDEILVTERGLPVARIMPVRATEQGEDARLRGLERQGLLTLGWRDLPDDFFDLPLPSDPGRHVLQGLLDDRESGL